MNKSQKIITAVCFSFVALLCIAAGYFIITAPKRVKLYIDNGTKKRTTVKLDSSQEEDLDGKTILLKSVPPGVHSIEIYGEDGKILEKEEVNCRRHGYVYIYNILSASTYAEYRMPYGIKLKKEEMIIPMKTEKFFEAGWGLCEPFPEKISLKGGGVALSRIGHFPMHPDCSCCRCMYESLFRGKK